MSFRPLMLLALAVGSAALAQQSHQGRARAFQLDSVAPTPTPTPSDTPAADAVPAATDAPSVPGGAAATASDAATVPGLRASFTLDTPIAVLIADPAARAVLDRDLPGLSSDENLDKFAKLGLRQFQPLTGGQLTDAMLTKVGGDLSALSGPLLAPIAPTRGGTSKRDHDDSR